MKSLQLSILALILVIVACAMAFTALKTATDLWYGSFYTFTTIVLLSAVIAARFRRGNEKAFWFGFAVFGWCFFVVGLGPWPNSFDDGGDGMGIALNQNSSSLSRPFLGTLSEAENGRPADNRQNHNEHHRHRSLADHPRHRRRRRRARHPDQETTWPARVGQVADNPGGVGLGHRLCVLDQIRPAIDLVFPERDVQERAIAQTAFATGPGSAPSTD